MTMKARPHGGEQPSTCALAPSLMATMAMTAETPMMMPSIVKNERILLRKRRAARGGR